MDDAPDSELIQRIAAELAAGRKLQAIKIHREASGKDLKASKDFVEALIPKLKEQDPEKYARLSASSGCLSVALVCLGILAATVACVIHLT